MAMPKHVFSSELYEEAIRQYVTVIAMMLLHSHINKLIFCRHIALL